MKLVLKYVVLLFGVMLFFLDSLTQPEKDKSHIHHSDRPNIVLINIDDLGWRDLGYMGSKYYETPNIDQLSRDGMVFSRAYAAASNCSPSRAALFSGQYAPRTGVYTVNNSDRGKSASRKIIPTENTVYLPDSVITIAEVLQQNGYRTAHAGKWHITRDPGKEGFDTNIGGLGAGNPRAEGMGGYFAPYNNPHLEEGPKGEYLNDRITDESISFLKSVEYGEPFFLNYSPYIVHTPIQPKEELKQEYAQKTGSFGQQDPGYAAMVETMDRNVGRLINWLKDNGQFENTLIIFTSDNGGVFRITRQLPLRAGKGSYYEGGIRVPMIVSWPGVVPEGSFSDEPITNLDFFPTILEAAGINKPDDVILDGQSMMPVMRGKEVQERTLFWHFPIYLQNGNEETSDHYFRTRPGSVIMQGPWKLHEYFEDGRLELYNLETDIGERKNLIELYPDIADSMHERLKEWRRELNAPVPDQANPEYKPDKIE